MTSAGPGPEPPPFEMPEEPEGWTTGTAIDEFTPIYLALAKPTKRHGALSPSEVDALDLTVVAALLGIGTAGQMDPEAWDAEANDLLRQRVAAAQRGEEFRID